MKILHVNMDFLPSIGGVQVVMHNLALEQTKAGHDVCVLTNRKSARAMRHKLPYRVLPVFHRNSHMFRVKDSWIKHLFFKIQAWWIQRNGPFDVCHLHGAMPEGDFIQCMQDAGVKVVLTLHGDDIETVPEIGYGARLEPRKNAEISRRVRQCDALVGLTRVLADEIVTMGAAKERVHVLPDGVRLDQFRTGAFSRLQIRQRFGLPEDKLVVATIGRNHPIKGLAAVPEALEALLAIRQNVVWALVGPKAEEFEPLIKSRGLEEYLLFLPAISMSEEERQQGRYLFPPLEMVAFLKAVDVVVIPSLSETFCLGMVEAMAAGTVVVGADIPGLRHILGDGVTGLSYPQGDARALAEAVNRVLDDELLKQKLVTKAHEAVKELDWAVVAQRHLQLYKSLV